jgi:hypothetical protein
MVSAGHYNEDFSGKEERRSRQFLLCWLLHHTSIKKSEDQGSQDVKEKTSRKGEGKKRIKGETRIVCGRETHSFRQQHPSTPTS